MKLTPYIKLLIWSYACWLVWIITDWHKLNWPVDWLTAARLTKWLIASVFAPYLLRLPFYVRLSGWSCLIGLMGIVAVGPMIPEQPGPWLEYLSWAVLGGIGVYLCLIDLDVRRYIETPSRSEPDARPNDASAVASSL